MNKTVCLSMLSGAFFLLLIEPTYAQAFDASALNTFLQSVIDALTGTTGRLIMTIVFIGVLISGALNLLDWTKVFVTLGIIVVLAGVTTLIQAIWGTP